MSLSILTGCTYYRTPQLDSSLSVSKLEQMCADAARSCEAGIIEKGLNSLTSGSNGLPDSPYVVCNENQLQQISYSSSETGWAYENLNKNFILGRDISFSSNFQGILSPNALEYTKALTEHFRSEVMLRDGTEEYPIGFSGSFQGCGHTLSDLHFSAENRKIQTKYYFDRFMGLFNTLASGATISNLIIDSALIEDSIDKNGMVAGYATDVMSYLTGASGPITLEKITIRNSTINSAIADNGLLIGRVLFVDEGSLNADQIEILDSSIVNFLNIENPRFFNENLLIRESYYVVSTFNNAGFIGSYADYGKGKSSIQNISLNGYELNSIVNPFIEFGSFAAGAFFGQIELGKNASLEIKSVDLNTNLYLDPASQGIGTIVGFLQQYGSSKLSISDVDYTGYIISSTSWGTGAFGYSMLYGDETSSFDLKNIRLNGTMVDSNACGATASVFGAIYSGEFQTLNISDITTKGSIKCGIQDSKSFFMFQPALGSLMGEGIFEEDFNLNVTRFYSSDRISAISYWNVGALFGLGEFYNVKTEISEILFEGKLEGKTSASAMLSDFGSSSSGSFGSAFGYLELGDDRTRSTEFILDRAIFKGNISLGNSSYDVGGLIGETRTRYNLSESKATFQNILMQYKLDLGSEFSGSLGALAAYFDSGNNLSFKNIISDVQANVRFSSSSPQFGIFGRNLPEGLDVQGCYYGEGWTNSNLTDQGFSLNDIDQFSPTSEGDLTGTKIYFGFDPTIWNISGNSVPTIPSAMKLK